MSTRRLGKECVIGSGGKAGDILAVACSRCNTVFRKPISMSQLFLEGYWGTIFREQKFC